LSIKTAVKEHFENGPIADHWAYFFSNEGVDEFAGSIRADNGLNIRRFIWKDLDECAELFKKVFSANPWYDNWVSSDQARNYLIELIENPVFEGFVAYENSKIVAVCLGHRRSWWMGKEFFVDEFFVENKRQRNGIGTKTLDIITNNLAEEGYTRLTLLTNKEIPAERFYIKNGFNNNQQRTVMVKNIQ
jgi:aminoglycoside 6'-N-acetyltransferase I